MTMNRAVFVDRDHTIIDDPGYLADPDRVRLLPGAAEAITRFRTAGYYVVVVTNQSGVARGLLTETQLAAVHQRMQDLLRAQGSGVDAVYYCPFLDGDEAVVAEYRRDSDLRKPKPGMLKLAASELNLNLSRSWMVGDDERDVEAGRAAGCRTVRIRLTDGEQTRADRVAPDLAGAADVVLSESIGPGPDEPARTIRTSPVATTPPPPKPAAATAPVAPPMTTTVAPAAAPPAPAMPARPATTEELLAQILEEVRTARRRSLHSEFSAATLAAAVSQVFALFMLGWGLYAAVDAGKPEATSSAFIRLLAAVAFQLLTLTCFLAGRRN